MNEFEVVRLMNKLNITEQEARELIKYSDSVDKKIPQTEKVLKSTTISKPEIKPTPQPALPKKPTNMKTLSKEDLIEQMRAFVAELPVEGVQFLKSNSVSFKDENGKYYTIALTAHKGCPTGYKE